MPTRKQTTERITVNREYLTEASKPGAPVMRLKVVLTGRPTYGWMGGIASVARSGVRPPVDDFSGDMPVTGMYAFLGDKQREGVSVTLDSTPHPFSGGQTVSGQMLLASDLRTGYATFTYTSRDDRTPTTVENVKVSAVKTES